MSFKNENIAIVVFVLVLVVGYSVTGWNELSEGEAAVIVPSAFVLAAATTAVLYARDDRRRDARERAGDAHPDGDSRGRDQHASPPRRS